MAAPYMLQNMYDSSVYLCQERIWHQIIDTAFQRGFQPVGTRLDYYYELDLVWDDETTFMEKIFMSIMTHARCLNWNKYNFKDRENQIVCDEDSSELLYVLQDILPQDLKDFFSKGSFRICSQ
ncbi:MAG: hypothetical protein WHV26_12055 [Spirochaetota bacterium]